MAHRNLCINIDLLSWKNFFLLRLIIMTRVVAESDDEKSIKCMMQAMQGDTEKKRFDNSPKEMRWRR